MRIVRCTHCNKEGTFDLNMVFVYRTTHCGECHAIKQAEWRYWFCDQDCMFNWLDVKEVRTQGFPCRDCVSYDNNNEPTGWAWGFESNGPCKTCHGAKRVKSVNTTRVQNNQELQAPEPAVS